MNYIIKFKFFFKFLALSFDIFNSRISDFNVQLKQFFIKNSIDILKNQPEAFCEFILTQFKESLFDVCLGLKNSSHEFLYLVIRFYNSCVSSEEIVANKLKILISSSPKIVS